jgi:hypothetical protein
VANIFQQKASMAFKRIWQYSQSAGNIFMEDFRLINSLVNYL